MSFSCKLSSITASMEDYHWLITYILILFKIVDKSCKWMAFWQYHVLSSWTVQQMSKQISSHCKNVTRRSRYIFDRSERWINRLQADSSSEWCRKSFPFSCFLKKGSLSNESLYTTQSAQLCIFNSHQCYWLNVVAERAALPSIFSAATPNQWALQSGYGWTRYGLQSILKIF